MMMMFFKNRSEREVALRLFFLIAVVVFCIAVVFSVPVILATVLISAVLTYLFFPLVNKMEAKGVSRSLSILMIYVIVGGILFLTYKQSYTGLVSEFNTLQKEFPKILQRALEQCRLIEDRYDTTFVFLKDLRAVERIEEYVVNTTQSVLIATPSFLSSLVIFIILVPLFTFFLLRDGKKVKRWVLDMLPNRYLESGVKVLFNINKQMEGFVQARLLETAVLGVIIYVGLMLLGIKYLLFLSLFAAIFNLVPYIGPIIGAVPGIAVAYFYSDNITAVWLTVLVYTVAQFIDAFITIPLVFSKRINIHPMMVIVLIIIGNSLMGIVGMILAVPFFCILKALFDAISSRIIVSQ